MYKLPTTLMRNLLIHVFWEAIFTGFILPCVLDDETLASFIKESTQEKGERKNKERGPNVRA